MVSYYWNPDADLNLLVLRGEFPLWELVSLGFQWFRWFCLQISGNSLPDTRQGLLVLACHLFLRSLVYRTNLYLANVLPFCSTILVSMSYPSFLISRTRADSLKTPKRFKACSGVIAFPLMIQSRSFCFADFVFTGVCFPGISLSWIR